MATAELNPSLLGVNILTGAARFALAKAASYARERRVWGQPIGTHQGVAGLPKPYGAGVAPQGQP